MQPNNESVMVDGRASRRRRWLRAGLAVLAATDTLIGGWALVAPRSFYGNLFPGLGGDWVSALGPYDEHLVRDFGGALFAIAVLLWLATVVFEHRLVQGALVAAAVQGVPHFAYHLTTIDELGALANAASLVGLIYLAALPLLLLSLTRSGG